MPRVRPLSLALVIALTVLLPLVSTRDGYAQDASPTAGAWVGSEPDLAAMPITPGDLEVMGLPGFGASSTATSAPSRTSSRGRRGTMAALLRRPTPWPTA